MVSFLWDTNMLSFFPFGKNLLWHSCLLQKLPEMGLDLSWSWQATDGLAASQIMMLRLTLGVLFSLFTLQGSVGSSMRSLHFWAESKSSKATEGPRPFVVLGPFIILERIKGARMYSQPVFRKDLLSLLLPDFWVLQEGELPSTALLHGPKSII